MEALEISRIDLHLRTYPLRLTLLFFVQGRAPSVWQVDSLPHDSWDLVSVPSPVGGVQVRSETVG